MAHLKGQNVNLIIDGAVIAASRSCDFSITANTTDAAAKDDANPMWDNPAFTYADWSASNESFIIGTAYLKTLLTKMVSGDCTCTLKWQCTGLADSGMCRQGQAIITNLQLSAPVDDYVTLSLSFEGAGPLSEASQTEITPITAFRDKMRGKAMMLALDEENTGTSYATVCAATSHTLTISVQTSTVLTKDDNDKAINKEVTGKTMTLTTENLYNIGDSETCQALKQNYLIDGATTGQVFGLQFGYYSNAVGNAVDSDGNWGAPSTVIVTATAIVSSWSSSAANKENATFTAEFAICGVPTVTA